MEPLEETCDPMPSDCGASVEMVVQCQTEYAQTFADFINSFPECSMVTLESLDVAEPELPASCQALEAMCPDAFDG